MSRRYFTINQWDEQITLLSLSFAKLCGHQMFQTSNVWGNSGIDSCLKWNSALPTEARFLWLFPSWLLLYKTYLFTRRKSIFSIVYFIFFTYSFADSKCSGRASCEIVGAVMAINGIRPCPLELSTYLQAGYICLTGISYNPECLGVVLFQITNTCIQG